MVVPKSETTVHDNWYVAGLQGTGSYDYSLTAVFVPARRVIDGIGIPARCGGGRVLALDHPMQRHLRNLTAVMQHLYITDENYERAGKARITRLSA